MVKHSIDGMVDQAINIPTSGLTVFEELTPERLAYLERDRWPEFERELRFRRNRKTHFMLRQHYAGSPGWAWMIWKCRKWEEIEKVLNKHNADYRWIDRRRVLELDRAEIYRCP